MTRSGYLSDLAHIAVETRLSRRQFIAAAAAGTLLPRAAAAKASEIVFATWGGEEIKNLTKVYAKPYTGTTGTNVIFDGTGPTEGAIKTMVDSGDVSWDVCDADGFSALRLGRAGALSAIDYSVIDRQAVLPPFAFDHGVCGYTYSYVLAYDAELYKNQPPTSWADFWNQKKFPGRRALWKWMNGGFEAAMIAAGAKPHEIYPIDIPNVVERIRRLKPNLLTWESGAQSKQMLIDKTVSMACIWHSRAAQLATETEGRIAWTWAQGILYPGCWVVPKNNPAGADAFNFIASMQDPGRQVAFSAIQGVGPGNPAATASMPGNLRPIDPTQPEALAQQIVSDTGWWADNYDLATKKFQEMLNQA